MMHTPREKLCLDNGLPSGGGSNGASVSSSREEELSKRVDIILPGLPEKIKQKASACEKEPASSLERITPILALYDRESLVGKGVSSALGIDIIEPDTTEARKSAALSKICDQIEAAGAIPLTMNGLVRFAMGSGVTIGSKWVLCAYHPESSTGVVDLHDIFKSKVFRRKVN